MDLVWDIFLPCILPLIPIVLGVSIANNNKWRPLVTILGMIIGFVGFTFVLQVLLRQFVVLADYIRIGTFYALLLFGIGFAIHNKSFSYILVILGSIFFLEKGIPAVIIAAIFGIIALHIGSRIATKIQQLGTNVQQATNATIGKDSLLTAFIIGLTMGLVWVPCAGPALSFALTLVRDEPGLKALIYLSIYGIGAGIPLVIIGYGGQYVLHSVRSLNKYTGRIKQVSGIILILSAIALQYNVIKTIETWLVNNTSYGIFATKLELFW